MTMLFIMLIFDQEIVKDIMNDNVIQNTVNDSLTISQSAHLFNVFLFVLTQLQ